jgi:uncharacterized repeat protein (TIGR03803 family)
MTPAGTLTTLHSFDGTDGSEPYAGLVEGRDGNFYGTTYYGGANSCQRQGCGTVFTITPNGTLTTLYSFCSQSGCKDGQQPQGGLVEGSDGNFYGTTTWGGLAQRNYCTDGYGCGTVFKITPHGILTTLHEFCSHGGCPDGYWPYSGLVRGTDGNFYGTTYLGGANQSGTVFRITASGTFTTLYSFCLQYVNDICMDGGTPIGALVQGTNGTFYGTAWSGGEQSYDCPQGCGTIFSLSVGLGPFVETNPAVGKVGASVGILGTDLTGATSVTLNGTQTAFRVISKTFIEAKVPSGATSGTVKVQLPGGKLSSNVPFIVVR